MRAPMCERRKKRLRRHPEKRCPGFLGLPNGQGGQDDQVVLLRPRGSTVSAGPVSVVVNLVVVG